MAKEIEQLKRYVLQSEELSEPLNYFFDLTDAGVFSKMKSHQAVKNIDKRLELQALTQIACQELNSRLHKSITQLTPAFFEIPEHHFIHGVCMSAELKMGVNVLFFSDVQTGIFSTVDLQTEMFRFVLMRQSEIKNLH